jgi:hypothetical protein
MRRVGCTCGVPRRRLPWTRDGLEIGRVPSQHPGLNSSAALLVWENVWASRVAQAIRDAGGIMVAFDRIPHGIVQEAREAVLEAAQA